MSHVDSPVQTSGRRPLRVRPYMVLAELPEAMSEPGGRGAGHWPLDQLIKDWNNQPESRDLMLVGGLPEGTDHTTAAKIAAVVHALCERDGHPVPAWVQSARCPVEVALVPNVDLRSPFGRQIRRTVPGGVPPSPGLLRGGGSRIDVNAIPNGGRLDATAIRRLLSSVSSHLRQAQSFNHHLMVVGGAALALMWEDRSTFDVDVLEHRFKAPPDPVTAERRTGAVDFHLDALPRRVGQRRQPRRRGRAPSSHLAQRGRCHLHPRLRPRPTGPLPKRLPYRRGSLPESAVGDETPRRTG